jgi:hypothetical protein
MSVPRHPGPPDHTDVTRPLRLGAVGIGSIWFIDLHLARIAVSMPDPILLAPSRLQGFRNGSGQEAALEAPVSPLLRYWTVAGSAERRSSYREAEVWER